MFCHKCGKELLKNAKFCSYCGLEISNKINEKTEIRVAKIEQSQKKQKHLLEKKHIES